MEKPQKTAQQLRDEALERVKKRAGTWYARAFSHLMSVIARHAGQVMTAEQLRLLVYPTVGQPEHHNVWGAMTREFVKMGMLVKVGFVQMTTPKSHARLTAAYRLVP